MASRYVTAAGGLWSATATWAATSGGAGGASVPVAGDDVHLDANSGNLTLDTGGACLSFDCTGYTGSLIHNSTVKMNLSGGMAVSGVALKLVSTMTYTIVSSINSEWQFLVGGAGVTGNVTCAAKTVGNMSFGTNSSSSHQLADGYAQATSASTTLNNGTLDFNGQSCTLGQFNSSNASARTIAFGTNAAITVTGGWNTSTQTNLSDSTGTATITGTAANFGWTGGSSSQSIYNNVSLVFNGAGNVAFNNGNATFASLSRTATAAKTDTLTFNGSPTITGALTLQGNSVVNRLGVQTNTVGTQYTIAANGSVSVSNADFMDIAAAGTTGTWTGTSLGDAQGNSNINFNSNRTLYGVSPGNWDATTTWGLSSGGASGQTPPLPQDDVILDSNSGGPGTTYTLNSVPRQGRNISTVGYPGTYQIAFANTTIYGNVTLGPGTTTAGSSNLFLAGRGAQTITSNGVNWSSGPTIQAPGGSYSLQDDYRGGNLAVTAGTFNSQNHSISCNALAGNSSITRTWNLGSSRVDLWGTGGGNPFGFAGGGTVTFNFANATFYLHGTGSGNLTVGTFLDGTVIGAVYVMSPGSGVVQIQNSFTASVLSISPGRQVQVTSTKTITVTTAGGWQAVGQNWNAAGFQYLSNDRGHYISVPNSTPLQITGDITLDGCVAPVTWGAAEAIIGRWAQATTQSWILQLNAGRTVTFQWMDSGLVAHSLTSSVAVPFPDGAPGWVRASLATATGTGTFWISGDGTNWTQLGTTQTFGATTIANNTATAAILEIGSDQTGNGGLFSGKIFRARVFAGALGSGSGTPVLDADFSTKTWGQNTFTESSTNAATVTLNGSGAQVGDGRIQWGSTAAGTAWNVSVVSGNVQSDYLSLQDSHAAGGATFYAGSHSTLVSNDTGWTAADPPAPPSVTAGVFDPALNPTAWY